MHTIELTQAADESGTLHVAVPGQDPNREYRVVVLVEPALRSAQPMSFDERGWPVGYFERLAGSWQGEFLDEYEGDFEHRSEF
jgi:hypothetical protein